MPEREFRMNKTEFLHDLAELLKKHGGSKLVDIRYREENGEAYAYVLLTNGIRGVNITDDNPVEMLRHISGRMLWWDDFKVQK